MLQESPTLNCVMEGKGSYNAHARLQADGAAMSLPLLETAIRRLNLGPASQPIVIADYGSAQGKNSLAPMGFAIRCVREIAGPDTPIVVFHIDQPANDFNSLFAVLDRDPNSYDSDDAQVFPCAVGRSFYRHVLPGSSVDLGWSSYAAMWLSRIPRLIPNHFIALRSSGEVRAEFDRQAAKDWEAFLSLRSSELRPGGRLVVVLAGMDDDGVTGLEDLFDGANEVLATMVSDSAIRAGERARMVLGTYARRLCDLLAPFKSSGTFRGLTVEHCGNCTLKDAAWAGYQNDGRADILGARRALFFRSAFLPSLAVALAPDRSPADHAAFADCLEAGLARRSAAQPAPLDSIVQTIVLAKTANNA